MKLRNFLVAAMVGSLGFALACSSSESSSSSSSSSGGADGGSTSSSSGSTSSSSGGACSIKKDTVACSSITKQAGSAAECPDISCSQFNTKSDGGTTDDAGGSDPCDPKVDEVACTIKIDCTKTEGGTTTVTKGDFKASGSEVKGSMTIDISGAVTLKCGYDIVFK